MRAERNHRACHIVYTHESLHQKHTVFGCAVGKQGGSEPGENINTSSRNRWYTHAGEGFCGTRMKSLPTRVRGHEAVRERQALILAHLRADAASEFSPNLPTYTHTLVMPSCVRLDSFHAYPNARARDVDGRGLDFRERK